MIMERREDFRIDLEKIIANKTGKKMPRFVVKFLKRLIHEDFLNEYITRGDEGVAFCTGTLKYLGITMQVEGLENVPKDGTLYTFASNHPLGGIDGVAMGSIIGERFDGKVRYLVNDLLMNLKGLAPICVPVNVMGGQSRDLPRLIDEAYRSDNQMLIFPAQKVSRRIKGVIQDVDWAKSFIVKSVQTGRSIVPVHFIAHNSKRFYRIDKWCKFFGIKANLAMLTLPDEMYKSRGSTFRVIIGKPIPPAHFDGSKTPREWAQWVRAQVYSME